MIDYIYPNEHHQHKTITSDTGAPMLDLDSLIPNDIISAKIITNGMPLVFDMLSVHICMLMFLMQHPSVNMHISYFGNKFFLLRLDTF